MENFKDKLDDFISWLWDKTDTLLVIVSVTGVSAVVGYLGYTFFEGLLW